MGGELFGKVKGPRKRYQADITAAFFGITRKGKAPKYNTLGIQPIYITGKPNQMVRHAAPQRKQIIKMPTFTMPKQPKITFSPQKQRKPQMNFKMPSLNINFNAITKKRRK
jgi:hypothetical protein